MPVTFPLAHASFMDLIAISEATIPRLTEQTVPSRTRGGELLRNGVGGRLWTGRISVSPVYRDETDDHFSLLDLLLEPDASFLWYRKARLGPQYDPTGTILGAATPTIGAVSGDLRDLTINGLPAAYQLRRGDMLSFQYGSSPVRRALHKVVVSRTATGGGQITALSVTPHVRPGWAGGSAVTLLRPTCTAVVVPGTVELAKDVNRAATGFSFDWLQAPK